MEASDATTDPVQVYTPPPEHDAANFKAKRQATMMRLYCLFEERWELMNTTCMENNSFSQSDVSREVIEKLPEGKT